MSADSRPCARCGWPIKPGNLAYWFDNEAPPAGPRILDMKDKALYCSEFCCEKAKAEAAAKEPRP